MKDEVWHSLIVVITNASNLHGYAVRSLYRAVQEAGEQVLQELPRSPSSFFPFVPDCFCNLVIFLGRKLWFELQFGALENTVTC